MVLIEKELNKKFEATFYCVCTQNHFTLMLKPIQQFKREELSQLSVVAFFLYNPQNAYQIQEHNIASNSADDLDYKRSQCMQ